MKTRRNEEKAKKMNEMSFFCRKFDFLCEIVIVRVCVRVAC